MDRIKKIWQPEQSYETIQDIDQDEQYQDESRDAAPVHDRASNVVDPLDHSGIHSNGQSGDTQSSSYAEYGIFLLLGVSMLWAWNMFLAAGPYFQQRFFGHAWILSNFQAAEISVSTITNLVSMLVLTRMQAGASYPQRIIVALSLNMLVFAVLAASTATPAAAGGYFAFLMLMMFLSSLATGFSQNGVFAYVGGFGQPSYTQAIMTGQAIAGVLPPLAEIISVAAMDSHQDGGIDGAPPVPWTAALAYFLTATVISVVTLFAFLYLNGRHQRSLRLPDTSGRLDTSVHSSDALHEGDNGAEETKKSIPLLYLFGKLRYLASAVFLTFAVTMAFPVFTQQILSVHQPNSNRSSVFQPATFIPLAFLFWNVGDLAGRLLAGVQTISLVRRPRVVLALSFARIVFLGLYGLCNIKGQGAVIASDFFYLVVVQIGFGISNGFLGSTCMMGFGEYVEPEEQEAAGGFMGLCLVGGLTAGSLLSFAIAGS